ncbi:hypothetical protein D1BOALGB6SA_4008 [Olavius sp. associated proteobacterium Delta 1]|nr:hypothetical protein D1BOALGB6SA_4008 [Olavius sp. associated proteobacterium Delta 1]
MLCLYTSRRRATGLPSQSCGSSKSRAEKFLMARGTDY